MARGITESEVHAAADELVAAGERPTIDRIRAHLGTGSPNTVLRWLDTWWQVLGRRLQAHQARLSIPDAPDAVAILAGQWWAMAVEHARAEASAGLETERATILAQQEALRRDRDAFATEASALREKADTALHSERLALTQALELKRLVKQLESQVVDVTEQRDAALAKAAEAAAAQQATQVRLHELQDAAQAEREALTLHVRTLENRSHSEIDKARQDVKELRTRLAAATKKFSSDEQSLRAETARVISEAAQASHEASVQRARADALEQQLSKLQDLPAALEAVWRQGKKEPKRRKPVAKKSTGAKPATGKASPS